MISRSAIPCLIDQNISDRSAYGQVRFLIIHILEFEKYFLWILNIRYIFYFDVINILKWSDNPIWVYLWIEINELMMPLESFRGMCAVLCVCVVWVLYCFVLWWVGLCKVLYVLCCVVCVVFWMFWVVCIVCCVCVACDVYACVLFVSCVWRVLCVYCLCRVWLCVVGCVCLCNSKIVLCMFVWCSGKLYVACCVLYCACRCGLPLALSDA